MANVLIIDDDKTVNKMLTEMVNRLGHDATSAFARQEGLHEAISGDFDVVFLDVMLPDGSGLDILPKIRGIESPPEIIIMTGYGSPDGAEIAIENGAWDYVQKPLTPKKMILPLKRILQYQDSVNKSPQGPPTILKRKDIIGHSPEINRCFNLVAKACHTDATVLITGDTGTGKELFARAIHENSSREDKAFVVVDCASLPRTLVESVLFGYAKGAFTGADTSRIGLFKEAHEGTLFLDEVGELPVEIQSRFLRVLQEHAFRPVGGRDEIKSDFRLIAATNRDLDPMVSEGSFRNDLLFRLQSIRIDLPTLKKRRGDIKDLAFDCMAKFCDRYHTGTKGLSSEYLEALLAYSWPGNVRELKNALERSLTIARDDPVLLPIHLPTEIRARLARVTVETHTSRKSSSEGETKVSEAFPKFRDLLRKTERDYFKDLSSFAKGDIKEICRISDLSRAQVYKLMKRHNISRQA